MVEAVPVPKDSREVLVVVVGLILLRELVMLGLVYNLAKIQEFLVSTHNMVIQVAMVIIPHQPVVAVVVVLVALAVTVIVPGETLRSMEEMVVLEYLTA
jgi:hypothetical protein